MQPNFYTLGQRKWRTSGSYLGTEVSAAGPVLLTQRGFVTRTCITANDGCWTPLHFWPLRFLFRNV